MPYYSLSFLFFFLPAVLLGCYLSGQRFRNSFLLFSSLVFYSWTGFSTLYILLLITGGNYLAGLLLTRLRADWQRKAFLALAIAANLYPLLYYKYSGFFLSSLNQMLPQWNLSFHLPDNAEIPLGISFITFHAVSYLTDVFRRKAAAQTNIVRLGLYFTFFPKIFSGPIQRYAEAEPQFAFHKTKVANFSSGVERFILGLSKKLLLANTLADLADHIFQSPAADLAVGIAWLGAVCYALQIYFDFSGYTDMAIGIGLMCGFRLPENFEYPYTAQSVQEFWHRWHITLSQWFREYLYFPLGGNRRGQLRTYCNLLIVFLLCGLWHGASWSFVVWGLMHGVFLVMERYFLADLLSRMPKIIRHCYLLLFIAVSWVFFRKENLVEAWHYLKVMAGFSVNPPVNPWILLQMDRQLFFVLLISAILAFPFLPQAAAAASRRSPAIATVAKGIALALLFILSLMELASGTHNPFIYFRF